jgi:hypothetical protein
MAETNEAITKCGRNYDTTVSIQPNGESKPVTVAYAKEVSFDIDYNNQQEDTHSGRMTHASQYPGVQVTINKLTKFEHSDENQFLAAICMLRDRGGTVTMITKEPNGQLVIKAMDCRPDSEEWSNEAGNFVEVDLTLQAESLTRGFYAPDKKVSQTK